MKQCMFMTLFLFTALTFPGWAQQNNSSSSAQQNVSQNGSDREPLQAPAPKGFWDGDDPNVVNLVTHPFATKSYVQRQTRPIHDRLNELDELTSENSQMIKDIDARAQHGIQMASEKSSLADQHATDALSKAEIAKKTSTDTSTRVSSAEQMVASFDQYKGSAQTEIHFRAGQDSLSKDAKDALDAMAMPLKSAHNYIIEVHGIAAGRSQAALANAKRMSGSVVRYLVLTHEIPMYRISVMNLGADQTKKDVRGGRIEISVLENQSVSTAQR